MEDEDQVRGVGLPEALTLYRALAADNPDQYQELYNQRLAALQRAYNQAGRTDEALRLHLTDPHNEPTDSTPPTD